MFQHHNDGNGHFCKYSLPDILSRIIWMNNRIFVSHGKIGTFAYQFLYVMQQILEELCYNINMYFVCV